MSRFVSVIVATALILNSISPMAASQRHPSDSPGAVCPMMHQPASTSMPCIGETCPCHRGGSGGSLLPDGANLSVPEPAVAIALPVTSSTRIRTAVIPRASGFSDPVDHPPDLRG
jgi:hypothetical protein